MREKEDNNVNVYQENLKKLQRSSQKDKHEMAFLLMVRSAGLPEPVREFRFHPKRMWRLDFAWVEYKIGVEIEGGIWRKGGGAHSHPSNIQRDIEKQNNLVLLGWSLLRFSERELKSLEAIEYVKKLMDLKIQMASHYGSILSGGCRPAATSGGR